MTLARSWEAAESQGFPSVVAATLATAADPVLQDLSMLIAILEYQVALPGGDRASQTDLLVLARGFYCDQGVFLSLFSTVLDSVIID